MSLNLKTCTQDCFNCIKQYIDKHQLIKGDSFKVPCRGIPQEYIPSDVLETLDTDPEIAVASQDIITWARLFLDWHCIDPEGEVWRIKTEDGTLPPEIHRYDPELAKKGKSPFNRPYQKLMLSCSSKRKVFRTGRQIGKSTMISIACLFNMWNNENFPIVLIAPYQSQIDLLFNKINQFIRGNPLLYNSVHRNVKGPNYQIELKNGSNIKGFTAGSKSGQDAGAARGSSAQMLCFERGTLVNTSEYACKPIERLTLDDTVCGGSREEISVGDIEALFERQAFVIRLTTPLSTVRCTPEHPIFDGKKDVPAKEVKNAVVSLAHQHLSFRQDVILARLMGYNFGDGWITEGDNTMYFSGSSVDLEQISQDISVLGGNECHGEDLPSENRTLGIIGTTATIGSRYAYRLIGSLCPQGKKVYQQLKIPEVILNGSVATKRNFLSGLYSAEGSTLRYMKNGTSICAIEIKMDSTIEEFSKKWVGEVAGLFKELGIRVSKTEVKKKKKVDNKKKGDRWCGLVRIANSIDNIVRFIDIIGACYNVKKRQAFNKYKIYRWYLENYNKECWKTNRKIRRLSHLSRKEIASALKCSIGLVKHHRRQYHPLFSEEKLTVEELISKLSIISKDYVLLPVFQDKSKKPVPAVVYNLTSSAHHRYFGNGFLSHNCFDEMDMLNTADIDAALAIITNFPDASVWMASTPTGKRERFWSACRDSLIKEFHYPSQVNPNWTEELEALYQSQLTEEGYKHEILGEFSIQEEGVYQQKYIQAAQEEYSYGDLKPNPNWIYTMGVDWNDVKIGTTMAVVGWNRIDKKFFLVDKEIISRADFTQLSACQRVAELNRIWQPNSVYVDVGYGATNVEVLHDFGGKALVKHGINHPDARLAKIVKGYDFGGAVEVYDLFTKQKVKKPAKPYLVENSVRRFENYEFKFPKEDERFATQLAGYIVDRITQTGRPVYAQQNREAGGDHMIDAVNLALVAFMLEETPWGRPVVDTRIGFSESIFSSLKNPSNDHQSSSPKRAEEVRQPTNNRLGVLNPDVRLIADPTNQLPAVGKTQPLKLWSWPGWDRDAPPPTRNFKRKPSRRSLNGPPRRKKF